MKVIQDLLTPFLEAKLKDLLYCFLMTHFPLILAVML